MKLMLTLQVFVSVNNETAREGKVTGKYTLVSSIGPNLLSKTYYIIINYSEAIMHMKKSELETGRKMNSPSRNQVHIVLNMTIKPSAPSHLLWVLGGGATIYLVLLAVSCT